MGSVTRWAVLATTLAATAGPPADDIEPVAPPRRGEASLRLATPRYRIAETAAGRHRIDIDGFGRASVPNSPALPFTILEVEVPDGVSAASVRLQPGGMTTRRMSGSFRIEDAPRPIGDRRPPAAILDEEDAPRPAPRGVFPTEPFAVLDVVSRWGEDGKRRSFARVLYSPFQVDVASGQLRMTTATLLKLLYDVPLARFFPRCDRFDYVIVTTRAIRDASTRLAPFVWHKESRGFSVRVVTEDDFDALVGPYPNGRAERIRKWLQTHYQEMGIRYVLLVGNPDPDDPMYTNDVVGDIPMKQVWHRMAGEMIGGSANNGLFWGDATDWYYSDLTGNWDPNGDGFYGVRPWLRPQDVVKSALPTGVPASGFSVRWMGILTVPTAGVVGLQLETWPYGRVFLDGNPVIDHWASGAPTKESRRVDLPLSAGTHGLRVEYKQPGSHGHIRFGHVPGNTGATVSGYTAEYFANLGLSGPPQANVAGEALTKNWENSDYVAQGGGGVDLNGEVAVGRIPVFDGDVAALDKTLDRIMAYETGFAPDRDNVLVVMKPLDGNTPLHDLGEAIVNDHLLPANLRPYRIYDDATLNPPPDATPVNPVNVVAGWNRGVGAVFTQSHGNARWTDQILDAAYYIPPPVGTTPYVTADHPAIAAFIGCHVGWPYVPDCYPGCAAVRNSLGDARSALAISSLREIAVAVIAATEVSTYKGGPFAPNPLRRYDEDLNYLYAREIAANQPVGEAMRRVHYTHFFSDVADKQSVYHNQLIHVLYGDPSVRMHTPCNADGSPCVSGDMRGTWTIPGNERPFIWENFVPKICQYVIDCPGCSSGGLCQFGAAIDLAEAVTLEVRDPRGRIVASSPRGTSHQLRFRYDPAVAYRLVARDPQARPGEPRKTVRGLQAKWLMPPAP